MFAGVILLALILSVGVGYSIWTGRLRVNVGIHTAVSDDPSIEFYQVFICCSHEHDCCCNHNNGAGHGHGHHGDDCDCKGADDDQVGFTDNMRAITITGLECNGSCGCCSGCEDHNNSSTQCQHCGSGHEANMSLWVGLVLKNNGDIPLRLTGVLVTTAGSYNDMRLDYYAYGPYTTSFQEVWGHVDPCTLPFPGYVNGIVLDGGEKIVLWIHVEYTNTTTIQSVTLKPVFENWNQ